MSDTYHTEIDNSDLLRPKRHHQHRAIIGSRNELVILGRVDIAYPTNILARFSMSPRINYLPAAFTLLGYLHTHTSEKIKINPRPFNYSSLLGITPEFQTWKEFYPDAQQHLPCDRPGLTVNGTIDHSGYEGRNTCVR
jgi:hypothetical protein